MSKKPSLKKAKQAVQKAVRVLTKEEYSELHSMVILPFEQAVDNSRNNDELFFSISENLVSLFGLTPSYEIFMLYRDETQKALLESRKITSDTFKNHYWKYVREFLTETKGFVFPVSTSESAVKKQEQREKALSLTKNDGTLHSLIDISDDDLREGLFGSKGKKALIDREDAIQKESNNLQLQNARKFRDDFVPKMKELAINEYDFAMWIDTNLNTLREQFKKQS
tara:strand:+ start:692 stop:1366 length:675 start_codon:yes stop_codon:yes gene_type:complete